MSKVSPYVQKLQYHSSSIFEATFSLHQNRPLKHCNRRTNMITVATPQTKYELRYKHTVLCMHERKEGELECAAYVRSENSEPQTFAVDD